MAKKPIRKPRTEAIYATTVRDDMTHIIVHIDQQTGEISFGDEMTNIYSEVGYERAKGPKVLNRIPQNHASLSFDKEPALLRNFDFLVAVDTNTTQIEGKNVSVTGIYTFSPRSPDDPEIIHTQ